MRTCTITHLDIGGLCTITSNLCIKTATCAPPLWMKPRVLHIVLVHRPGLAGT